MVHSRHISAISVNTKLRMAGWLTEKGDPKKLKELSINIATIVNSHALVPEWKKEL